MSRLVHSLVMVARVYGLQYSIGILKSYISTSHRSISQRLHSYFGKSRPSLRVHAPPLSPLREPGEEGREVDLEVIFISEEDGRESLVDLTKTLCDMAQRGKISSEDVSVELIDAEVTGMFIPRTCDVTGTNELQRTPFPSQTC